jgi:hypothetical protein
VRLASEREQEELRRQLFREKLVKMEQEKKSQVLGKIEQKELMVEEV